MSVARGRRGLAIGAIAVAIAGAAALPVLLNRAGSETTAVATATLPASAPAAAPAAVRTPVAPTSSLTAVQAITAAIDPLITASTDASAYAEGGEPPLALQPSPGSSAFKAALQLLDAGDNAAAYEAARDIPDPVERRTIQWAAIWFGNGVVPAAAVQRFVTDAPEFADDEVFKTRLEQALVREQAPGATIIETLGAATPSTIGGQIALADAYLAEGQRDEAGRIVRDIWVGNFLDRPTETRMLRKFGDLLDQSAHWDRAVHLLMHDRATAVERLMKFLSPAQKTLAVARIATARDAKDAKKLLDAVDPSMHANSVYLFSRAQRARQFELWDDAIAWLDKARGDVPDAAEFGYERRALTRQLLALGEVKRAYQAAAGYTEGPEGRVVELQFHAGWIALAFLRDAKLAAPHFELMAQQSTLPDTVTQSNYWLGRAREELGDGPGAKLAYEKAAELGTVYYGQLARVELGLKSVELRDMPDLEPAISTFDEREMIKAVRLLAGNGHNEMAVPLLRSVFPQFSAGADLALAAQLAETLGSHQLAISIAEAAEKRGIPLDPLSFPSDNLPTTKLAAIDPAAVYAITRQESRFQVDAISSAGARGLMQLMPGTAEETAGKLGVAYSKSRLTTDAEYNALLGSTYLKAQLERFDGSLVLAAAAYNAGGGNANKWIRAFGDPRSDSIDPIVWIELIPVQETRTYVKRVLGNYLVYRARLGKDDLSITDALRKIPS
jgi:soluble lytic murein transglycosylase